MKLEEVQNILTEFFSESQDNTGLILLSDAENRGFKLMCGKKGNIVRLLYNIFLSDEEEELIGLLDEAAKKYINTKQEEIGRNSLVWFVAAKNKYKS